MKYINQILIITFAITLLSGCDNNTGNSMPSENTAAVDSVTTETPANPIASNPTDSASGPQNNTTTGPEEPSLLLIEGNITKEQSGCYYYAYKVKNNTNQTITYIALYIVFLDEEGTIVYDTSMHSNVRVAPNQSIIIDSFDEMEDISGLTVVVDHYRCMFGDDNDIEEYVDDSPEIVFP